MILLIRNGTIAVSSTAGGGSRFEVRLPVVRKVRYQGLPEADLPSLRRGSGRVLVMDDDRGLRSVVCQLLNQMGYRADGAENGAVAVQKYGDALAARSPYDLVILDLIVRGGMGGQATMEALVCVDPDATVLLSSAFSEQPILERHREHGFKSLLRKPYSAADLSEAVSRVLEQCQSDHGLPNQFAVE